MNLNTLASPLRSRKSFSLIIFCSSFIAHHPSPSHAKLETWRQETSSAFAKGRRERVVLSDTGRVRLAQSLAPVGTLDAARVWDLARGPEGAIFAASGDAGKVFRREAKDDASWTVAYDGSDTQALSLAVRPDRHVFVGTGPTGQVVDVTDPKHPALRPDPSVNYVWDLAADPSGNLYAATGPTGQLWKLSPGGAWSLLLDSKHAHLLCVAVAPDGSVYAGSDGEGLIYRVGVDGKTSILFDAPQNEVRTLMVDDDGTLYAGTAAESGGGGGGGSSRVPLALSGGSSPSDHSGSSGTPAIAAQETPRPAGPIARPAAPSPPSGGSAAPRPPSPGDNAVYRVGSDGVAREVFRVKALILALAWQADRLLVGTGPEGQLYEVFERDRESAPIARLDNGQVLSLLAEPGGGVLLGAGDPGAILRLELGHVATGSLVSDVLDAKLISRFGALAWRAEQPPGTSVVLQVRTGNVGEPDSTWSDWSPEQADPDASKAQVPPGRFAQYRATLSTRNPSVTPELRSISLRYQTANLPPEITRLDVPDVGSSDGAARQAKLSLKWDVTDPNGDDLSYTLHIRKEGWPDWVRLGDHPLTSSSYDWDTTSVPAGLYRVRLSATDRPSNNPEDALSRDRASDPFIVDHEAPAVIVVPRASGASATLKDNLTRLVKAAYALDGGEWVPIFPDDGLFDTHRETITIALPDLKPGTHILVVRATDAAGNTGTGDALIEIH